MAEPGALEYFYGTEAEQYTFYRIPKVLFTDPGFRRITADAKILYGLMLDRMGLSIRNGWLDEQERVFIYFTLEEAMDAMCCGHNKAVSLFTELDKVGLIERKKQGQGRPTKIYVKNFIRKEEVKTSENRKSALPQTGTLDFRKSDTINTDKNMEPESLMSYMSFVFQDVTLFNDTVMNNIRLGNPNATDDQVIAAAKAAYCDEFVREMPDGYQTVLGENGSTLSGGERQRISIARALLKNAPIILLDEATASLDPENEVLVQKAIAKLVEGKTVIMIAHRLRTVVDADQILVLDNGRLVEHGTHDELMKKNGLYHKLFHIQQESLGWAV